MFHNQLQQVQQRINSVTQMAGQLRQAEENTRQKLIQIAQDEAYVAQQLLRVQQLCQESMSSLQSITVGQQSYTGVSQNPTYGQAISTGMATQFSPQSQQNQSELVNLTTMSPDTYKNSMQFMGGQSGQGYSGVGTGVMGQTSIQGSQTSLSRQTSGVGQIMGTESSLSGISTMGPDVYQSSREQLGKGSSNLSQIGQEAGINSPVTSNIGQLK